MWLCSAGFMGSVRGCVPGRWEPVVLVCGGRSGASGAVWEARSGDGPSCRGVSETADGEVGEVDRSGAGEDVGEDPGLAPTAGATPAPRPSGEVRDLAFCG